MSGKVLDAGYVDPYLLTPAIAWTSSQWTEVKFENAKQCEDCYVYL